MKLRMRRQLLVGFMLFSLFFGAGNLIFPPFLGNQSGTHMVVSFIGFIVTAVLLPVLGVVIVAKFDGLDKLASKVNSKFAIIFTITIMLAIGPGLGIPRAASVPFEMAIKPYLGEDMNPTLFMLLYSFVFFAIVLWLAFTPSKLLHRIGHILTPSLLLLLVVLFITFLVKGNVDIADAKGLYVDDPFLKGFTEGYNTMDTIAALNFGLVIANTLVMLGVKDRKSVVAHTAKIGAVAGGILAAIYLMLTYIGMATSAAYGNPDNGATILRHVVYDLFGNAGAIVLAAIFTLACLTTCVGLVTSISQYFSDRFKKLKYNWLIIIISVSAFVLCNLGLNSILAVSVPVLNAIYPMSIMLILLGLFDGLYKNNKFIYPITIGLTGLVSILYTFQKDLKVPFGAFGEFLDTYLPAYKGGFGWVCFAAFGIVLSLILGIFIKPKKKTPDEEPAVATAE